MIKNKNLSNIGIILIAVFLICSIFGFAQYKYTQQSGEGFFVSEADKSDALEDTNEVRMILDELGLLLKHSKYGDASYPADGNTTPGTLDIFDDYYTKLEIDAFGYISDITAESIGDLSDVDTTGWASGKVLKFDASGNLIVGTDEGGTGATTFVGLTDTPANYTGSANKFVQVNGTPDALIFDTIKEADISDLGNLVYLKTAIDTQTEMETIWGVTLMNELIDDTTPELGGNLDAKDKNITGAGSISFTQEFDNGIKTGNFSVDFSTDQKQKCTLTANTITLTLDTTNVKVGNYLLKIVNGGLATLTWASETGSIYWPGGTEPTLTESGTDIVTFYFDGTDWYCMAGLDFK